MVTNAKLPQLQVSREIRQLVDDLRAWERISKDKARNPSLKEILQFVADGPALAWKVRATKLAGKITTDSPLRKQEMLLGPALTTKTFPRPIGTRLLPSSDSMAMPLDCWIQLDLAEASKRLSVDLGDGLLQLWSLFVKFNNKPVLRVLDRATISKEKATTEFGELLFALKDYPVEEFEAVWMDIEDEKYPDKLKYPSKTPKDVGHTIWWSIATRFIPREKLELLERQVPNLHIYSRPAGWQSTYGDYGAARGKKLGSWSPLGLMTPESDEIRDAFPDELWRSGSGPQYKKQFIELCKLLDSNAYKPGTSCYMGGVPNLIQSSYREDWLAKGWRCLYNFDGPEELFNLGDAGTGQIFYRLRPNEKPEFAFDWSCF